MFGVGIELRGRQRGLERVRYEQGRLSPLPLFQHQQLQLLVHQVYIRHHRMGVLAAQLYMLQVSPAAHQLSERRRLAADPDIFLQEAETVVEVGRRAHQRRAVAAVAGVRTPEQAGIGRVSSWRCSADRPEHSRTGIIPHAGVGAL